MANLNELQASKLEKIQSNIDEEQKETEKKRSAKKSVKVKTSSDVKHRPENNKSEKVEKLETSRAGSENKGPAEDITK